jgi:hypothetical protein
MAAKPKTTQPPATQPDTLAFVVQHTPLMHDGALYQPGDAVELTEVQAQKQGANVAPVPTESVKE